MRNLGVWRLLAASMVLPALGDGMVEGAGLSASETSLGSALSPESRRSFLGALACRD